MNLQGQSIYDVFQWIAVAAILLTVALVIVVKIIRFNKQLHSGKDTPCTGCSHCTGCTDDSRNGYRRCNGCKSCKDGSL